MDKYPFRFYSSSTGESLDVETVTFTKEGSTTVTTYDGSSYTDAEFTYYPEVLETPAGELPPGTTLRYKGTLYVLRYGWHHNSSGQNLCTWYIEPLESTESNIVTTGYDSLSVPRPSTLKTVDKVMFTDFNDICFS